MNRESKQLFGVVVLSAMAAIGCGDSSDASATEPGANVLEQRRGGGSSLRDPRGAFIADVTANGTGCPAGTWETNLSPDGQTFTTTFSAYETEVNRRTTVSIKDCSLAVKLRSTGGRSYSVQSFYYQGYAYLERGVNAMQSANYYFQGAPDQGDTVETNLSGPYDRSFLFDDAVGVRNAWSPCGTERNLNILTRIRTTNNGSGRTGYVNLSAVDGSSKLVFRLQSRSCNGGNDWDNDDNDNGGWDNDDNDNGGWNGDGNDDDDNGGWNGNDDDNGGWNGDGNDDDDNGGWNGDGNDDDDNGGWNGGGRDRGGFTPPSGGPVIIDVDRDRNP